MKKLYESGLLALVLSIVTVATITAGDLDSKTWVST